ncbi:DUF4265 domain-containing protein [Cupriavidus oxalaticus]|uniref:hypothetical protein n=1 Tax=Cupriavidus oxalaticus TaxID=96344 RepID=UPI003F738A4A
MVTVKQEDLCESVDFVSFGEPLEHNAAAYVSLDTGKIYWTSEFIDAAELPEDLETSDRYLAVPDKKQLDLGRNLVLRFVDQELPACYEQVEGFFWRKGAYARFKDLLEREGKLERWYAFEAESLKSALRQWCAENELEMIE